MSHESSPCEGYQIETESAASITEDDPYHSKRSSSITPLSDPWLKETPKDLCNTLLEASPSASRPASAYMLNPPIDVDGLSWPSKNVSELLLHALILLWQA